MIKVGEHLKKSRRAQGLTIEEAAKKTKIKKAFVYFIEEEEWGRLPDFPVVLGFVKNLSTAYEIDRDLSVRLLKRDYPKRLQPDAPKPDLKPGFHWSPRLTFVSAILGVFILVGIYLGIQYRNFNAPPKINIEIPTENQVFPNPKVQIKGSVDPESTLVVNNQPIIINGDGFFEAELDVGKDTTKLEFKITGRNGKELKVEKNITIEKEDL